ncbi:hypothetical protein PPERSA_02182 [Pseudocohnilembus persalinus]|uniref:Uncharacterized protein n=1 Tax=Pseudocohnilembus persalinus TaxID=266149 RepID=A0A0V0QFV1_PSEPJ|nr:hypothetical protein PPERSA_02182 [Pseudocohnilembus persalinus]|eukprot:KRX01086.1 hypothetical protein PPERSA_02182 [Pseudocohnilembus persalinus]
MQKLKPIIQRNNQKIGQNQSNSFFEIQENYTPNQKVQTELSQNIQNQQEIQQIYNLETDRVEVQKIKKKKKKTRFSVNKDQEQFQEVKQEEVVRQKTPHPYSEKELFNYDIQENQKGVSKKINNKKVNELQNNNNNSRNQKQFGQKNKSNMNNSLPKIQNKLEQQQQKENSLEFKQKQEQIQKVSDKKRIENKKSLNVKVGGGLKQKQNINQNNLYKKKKNQEQNKLIKIQRQGQILPKKKLKYEEELGFTIEINNLTEIPNNFDLLEIEVFTVNQSYEFKQLSAANLPLESYKTRKKRICRNKFGIRLKNILKQTSTGIFD